MKEIKSIIINTLGLGPSSSSRKYIVEGDPGATFSLIITNEDGNYYNFPENTIITNSDNESLPNPTFSSTPARLNATTIGGDGFYEGTVSFPTVTDDDYYDITFSAEQHYDTVLSNDISNDNVYYLPRIHQYINTIVTFSVSSPTEDAGDERYNTYPSSVTLTGSNSRTSNPPGIQTVAVSWSPTLSADSFIIARQPEITDFQFTTTKTTKTAGSSSVDLELTSIVGLSPGMVVSGTGIASGATITKIYSGYKDINNSTTANPIYITPKILNNDQDGLTNDPGGTVILSAASTFVVDRTLTFTGGGPNASHDFNNTLFEISDFALIIDPVVTTTTAAVAAAATVIPVTSVNGIRDDVSVVTGIGINSDSAMTVTNISSLNLTVRALVAANNEALESGQTLTFTEASRAAKITGNITVLEYGVSNLTLNFNLDKILTIE